LVTVLLAHENRLVRQALSNSLSLQARIQVIGDAGGGAEALTKIQALGPDVVVADSRLSGLRGLLGDKPGVPEVIVLPLNGNGRRLAANPPTGTDDISYLIKAVMAATDRNNGREPGLKAVRGLTQRETQIIGLIADGLSNKQIGQDLGITERTVKYHISNILRKLGLFSRTEAAVAYLKNSLPTS
jgi:two-component system, NarL family, response regulator DegU